MDQSAPWWVCAIFSVLLLQHHRRLTAERLTVDVERPEQLARRLTANITMPNITIPIPCVGNFIRPCGNVSLPEEGLDIKLPFGTYHIDGGAELEPEVAMMDHAFSAYTVYVCAAIVIAWAVLTVAIPSKRQTFVTSVKRTFAGELEPKKMEGEIEDEPDTNIDSENFVAPGNIYRVLAACPPGSPGVSFSRWLGWSSKAFICAYMQIYLPCGFLNDVFSEWQLHSIKSPIWFLTNAGSFFTMFASLAAICSLFASKCCDNIRRGATANFYILTHEAPPAAEAPVSSSEDGGLPGFPAAAALGDLKVPAVADVADAKAKLGAALLMKPPAMPDVPSASQLAASLPMPTWPPLVITINEYFWCTFSMTMNISMSMLLQLVMFLKVATFTGTMESVAVVTLSLYFVIELDKKVMESDPKLRPMYRTQVKAQTVEKKYKPMWLKRIAAISMSLMNETVPLGLLGVVLFSWKNRNTGMEIGGDPFSQ